MNKYILNTYYAFVEIIRMDDETRYIRFVQIDTTNLINLVNYIFRVDKPKEIIQSNIKLYFTNDSI